MYTIKAICLFIILFTMTMVLNGSESKMPLSLMKSFHIAIRNNLLAAISRNNIKQARLNIKKEAVAYHISPRLSLDLDAAKSRTGSPGKDITGGIGVSKLFRSGTDIAFDLSSKLLYGQSSSYYGFDPAYKTGLTVTVLQPLHRGAGSSYHTYSEKTYALALWNTLIQYKEEISKIIKDVETAYWDYYYALRNLAVKKEALSLARKLLVMQKLRIKIGLQARVDLIESQSVVAGRKESLIQADNQVAKSKENLFYILNYYKLSKKLPSVKLITQPVIEKRQFSAKKYIAIALKKSFSYFLSKNQIKMNKYTLAYYKNLIKPELNLNFSLGLNGYNSQYFDTYGDLTRGDSFNLGVGLSLKLPLTSKSDKFELQKQQLVQKNLLLKLTDLRRTIINNVRNSIRDINAAVLRITAAKQAYKLTEKKLKVVVKKYSLKAASNNDVLLAQSEYLEASLKVEQAILDYKKNKALLYFYCGNNIEFYKIKIKAN